VEKGWKMPGLSSRSGEGERGKVAKGVNLFKRKGFRVELTEQEEGGKRNVVCKSRGTGESEARVAALKSMTFPAPRETTRGALAATQGGKKKEKKPRKKYEKGRGG